MDNFKNDVQKGLAGKKEKKKGVKMIYNYMNDNMPDWAKPTVQKLIKKGALNNEKGELMLTGTMLRLFVIHDRMGLYDR